MSDESAQTTSNTEENPQNELKDDKSEANISGEQAKDNSNNENGDGIVSKDVTGDNVDYQKYITYAEDGTAIYTDPATNYQYVFDKEKNQWVVKEGAPENEHYKWNPETQKWEPKNGATSVLTDGQHLYTDPDGVVYFWDEEKKAWFPKIDDDFMAIYQTNYGFIDNTSETTTATATTTTVSALTPTSSTEDDLDDVNKDETQKPMGKRKANQPAWFDEEPDKCTKVYVSNLPDDITEEEFVEVMSKCGMIFRDPRTKKLKIKLYAEPNGQLKGDGLVHYIRIESVQLAIDMLDGYEVKGRKIKVQRAQFQMRGEYNPKLKPKRNKKDKEKLKKLQDKLLDWRPDRMRGERGKHERVVILKNLFEPNIFENHVDLIIEYQNNVREECSKCGTVKKVVVYSSEPEGICEVRMSDPDEADLVIQMMDRRYFGKRLLSAETWDGKTKYKANETEDECIDRLSKWDEFLEQDDDDVEKPTATETPAAVEAVTQATAEIETEKND